MFTAAAKAAAYASRKRYLQLKAEEKVQNEFEIFAVRYDQGFTWQVRRFGGVIVMTGEECYATATEARARGAVTAAESRLRENV